MCFGHSLWRRWVSHPAKTFFVSSNELLDPDKQKYGKHYLCIFKPRSVFDFFAPIPLSKPGPLRQLECESLVALLWYCNSLAWSSSVLTNYFYILCLSVSFRSPFRGNCISLPDHADWGRVIMSTEPNTWFNYKPSTPHTTAQSCEECTKCSWYESIWHGHLPFLPLGQFVVPGGTVHTKFFGTNPQGLGNSNLLWNTRCNLHVSSCTVLFRNQTKIRDTFCWFFCSKNVGWVPPYCFLESVYVCEWSVFQQSWV